MEWFPRLRAMSLALDESEAEQNELKTLQVQLEQTQVVVSTLSQQLTELRDQVNHFFSFLFLMFGIFVLRFFRRGVSQGSFSIYVYDVYLIAKKIFYYKYSKNFSN